MKKYLFGLSAIVLAVAFSAFTNLSKAPIGKTYVQKFVSTSQSIAQNVANYPLNGVAVAVCGTNNEEACDIQALDKYTHLDAFSKRVLNTSTVPGGAAPYLTVTATLNSPTSTWYITSIVASDGGVVGTDFAFENATKL